MSNNINFFYARERHRFHLVDNSPLPVITALSAFLLVTSIIFYWHPTDCSSVSYTDNFVFQASVFMMTTVLFTWFLTVVYESGLGHHTQVVRRGLRLGMVLFIASEVMLFFSFFWAFFHVSLSPAISLGCVWPPESIQPLDVWGLPLTNTLLLLSSGLTLTLSHRALLKANNHYYTRIAAIHLLVTVVLGTTFLCCQYIEYKYGITFTWTETVFGSVFYITTGFHGLHVIIGTIFLMFCLIRMVLTTLDVTKVPVRFRAFVNYWSLFSFRKEQHVGFEAAAWYWHFVDVVWIFLFLTIYWWNTASVPVELDPSTIGIYIQ